MLSNVIPFLANRAHHGSPPLKWQTLASLRRLLLALALMGLLFSPAYGSSARQTTAYVVGFIEGQGINSASIVDNSAGGLSALAAVFSSLGAEIRLVNLQTPIQEDIQALVLVNPNRAISVENAARIWAHLEQGNHLLLALDPSNHAGNGNNHGDMSLVSLLDSEYGIRIQNTLVVPRWFTSNSLRELTSSYHDMRPLFGTHLVVEPLLVYDLPVRVWGARSVTVEPFGVNSMAQPLLGAASAYGEANLSVLADPPSPLQINTEDFTGTQIVAALGENSATGSRVVFVGDSQFLLNGFGLVKASNPRTPIYPGNEILAGQIAAWLLGIPQETPLALPSGYIWMALDGRSTDWSAELAPSSDNTGDVAAADYDIQFVNTFRNDGYLYLLVETAQPVNPESYVYLEVDGNSDGQTDRRLVLTSSGVFLLDTLDGSDVIIDADAVFQERVEGRIPLRVAGPRVRIARVCMLDASDLALAQQSDCVDDAISVPSVTGRDPQRNRLPNRLTITVYPTAGINLLSQPDPNSSSLESLDANQPLLPLGRSEAGDWIQVQTGRYVGWVASSLTIANGDVFTLPVTQPSES